MEAHMPRQQLGRSSFVAAAHLTGPRRAVVGNESAVHSVVCVHHVLHRHICGFAYKQASVHGCQVNPTVPADVAVRHDRALVLCVRQGQPQAARGADPVRRHPPLHTSVAEVLQDLPLPPQLSHHVCQPLPAGPLLHGLPLGQGSLVEGVVQAVLLEKHIPRLLADGGGLWNHLSIITTENAAAVGTVGGYGEQVLDGPATVEVEGSHPLIQLLRDEEDSVLKLLRGKKVIQQFGASVAQVPRHAVLIVEARQGGSGYTLRHCRVVELADEAGHWIAHYRQQARLISNLFVMRQHFLVVASAVVDDQVCWLC
mmetsp:Transcript_12030/g.33831  ORF Transcript_12030/g.33831 Transcript_12030/m.33831 type:complete len:312 (+) Transcript_12030:294-1229(+)